MAQAQATQLRGAVRRTRLIEAASEQFHRHGVAATALADVASAADIPPGNMFYYFRTKDSLAQAVALDWTRRIAESLADIDGASADPRQRLAILLERTKGRGPLYAELGCPLAGLARDLRQLAVEPAVAGAPLRQLTDWVARQLVAAGDSDADRHAAFMVAAIQGSFALAHAIGEAGVVDTVHGCLAEWLDEDSAEKVR